MGHSALPTEALEEAEFARAAWATHRVSCVSNFVALALHFRQQVGVHMGQHAAHVATHVVAGLLSSLPTAASHCCEGVAYKGNVAQTEGTLQKRLHDATQSALTDPVH